MNERSNVWRMFFVLALCVFLVAYSGAQQQRVGVIRGHVVDPVGATIKGGLVYVRKHGSSEGALEVAAHTDISGNFKLELPEGGYDILVTSSGFSAAVHTIPVRAGSNKSIAWTLNALGCDFPTINCDTFR